jgi:hypothetical protein
VPFLKFSRDKRGYENTYLMHAVTRRGKPARTRILYWYRTPPGVRVGRSPFDEEVRRTIESRNPGVVFNWDALAATPMPPPDNSEHWRERRRLEKAAKLARRQEAAEEETETIHADSDGEDEPGDIQAPPDVEMRRADASLDAAGEPSVPSAAVADSANRPAGPGGARRRRRRGGRRGGSNSAAAPAAESTPPDAPPSIPPDSSSEDE